VLYAGVELKDVAARIQSLATTSARNPAGQPINNQVSMNLMGLVGDGPRETTEMARERCFWCFVFWVFCKKTFLAPRGGPQKKTQRGGGGAFYRGCVSSVANPRVPDRVYKFEHRRRSSIRAIRRLRSLPEKRR